MEQFVLFVLKLTLYPVVFIGAWLCLGALYNWLRQCSCLKVATPCKAHLITCAVALVALWMMAPGMPTQVNTFGGMVSLGCYLACLYAGFRWVWSRRDDLLGWVKTRFELD